MRYKSVKIIEFENTTTCNSFCPVCVRFQADDDNALYLNPLVDFNKHLSTENIIKILSDPCVDDNVLIEFIGTAGDPLAHPNFLELLEVSIKLKPKAKFNIHTNGGLKNPDYYEKLGKLLSTTKWYDFQFSIDGLEDTNHIYRIGVQWDKIMENLRAFIKGGGIPTWQMVVFPWNKHQVEEARKFAKKIGCKSFNTRQNIFSGDLDTLMLNAKTNFNKKEFLPKSKKSLNEQSLLHDMHKKELQQILDSYTYVDDQCFSKEAIFVRPEGYIYPCCMFSSASYDKLNLALLEEAYFTPYEKGWNEIDKHSLSKIMSHQWWTDLKNGLDDNNPCDLCIQQCGVMKNTARHDIETQRTSL